MRRIFTVSIFAIFIILVAAKYYKPLWVSRFSLSPQHQVYQTSEQISSESLAIFNNRFLNVPLVDPEKPTAGVLGASNLNKKIEIDLSQQKLYAFEDNRKIFEFLISSGKWGRTPVGKFNIWIKLMASKMEGGRKELGTYYYLPNVQYVMYFYNNQIPKYRGFGIHGTYWHQNFGHPMSHGCINMKTEEAKQLYYWTNPDLQGKSSILASQENPGTEVIIYGTAPWE